MIFVNLNVGSAIENSGEFIIGKLSKTSEVFKDQTKSSYFYKYLIEKNPQTIIVNGLYPRIFVPLLYYKLSNKNIKLITIVRCYEEIYDIFNNKKNKSINENLIDDDLLEYLKVNDSLYIINDCNRKEKFPDIIEDKIVSCCGINSESSYTLNTKWSNRRKDFVMLGSLNEHKLSEKFLKLLKQTDIKIDCFGSIKNQSKEFNNLFNSVSNINYKGEIYWKDVSYILNQYKYYVLPHDGYEPFCNSLQQSILCGCIPLCKFKKDENWYRWVYSYCFVTYDEYNLLENMKSMYINNIIGDQISEQNRNRMIKNHSTDNIIKTLNREIEGVMYE